MATLVLTTVGTALGGPIGGALGGMLGQAVDTQLFGQGPRKGPRLEDLKLQTSSYGTPIPQLFGRMRVAGTVVWATDLQESEDVEGGGKGSPETVRYSYSCSFAVALSSRPIRSIKRIWADGKLVRGATGDSKIKTGFRWTRGDEAQDPDPLIASLEGMAATPAYRGLALAIFEDMALAEFGNRIPMLTFEVEADDAPVEVADVVRDISGSSFTVGEEDEHAPAVTGYAALGSDRRAAIEGLVDVAPIEARATPDRDGPTRAIRVIGMSEELGWSADGTAHASHGEWSQDGAGSLPAGVAIRYHDPDRDFLAGEMRSTVRGGRGEMIFDSAAALTAVEAKRWAAQAMARRWAGRDLITLRLPPDFLDLEPGDRLDLGWRSGLWRVVEVLIERFAVLAECRRLPCASGSCAADGGRAISQPDVAIGESTIRLFDLPDLGGLGDGRLRLHAAVGAAGAFKAVPISTLAAGQAGPSAVALRRARLGFAETALGSAPGQVVDALSTVDVRLIDTGQLLLNADDDALDAGANLCILGEEVMQFGRATELGDGRFRLSRLFRGRRGTEWAIESHRAGEPFAMIDGPALVPLVFDRTLAGQEVEANAHGVADDAANPPHDRRILADAANRPLSPVHFRVNRGQAVELSWTARSPAHWAWINGQAESAPGPFIVTLTGSSGALTTSVDADRLALSPEDLTRLGPGTVSAEIVAVGSFANSRPLVAEISL